MHMVILTNQCSKPKFYCSLCDPEALLFSLTENRSSHSCLLVGQLHYCCPHLLGICTTVITSKMNCCIKKSIYIVTSMKKAFKINPIRCPVPHMFYVLRNVLSIPGYWAWPSDVLCEKWLYYMSSPHTIWSQPSPWTLHWNIPLLNWSWDGGNLCSECNLQLKML